MKINIRTLIAFIAIVLSLMGLVLSRAMMSIGMILLIANAVIDKKVWINFKSFVRNPEFVGITLIFFIYLCSGPVFGVNDYYLERLRIKLPFLLLPFAFYCIPDFNKRFFHLLLYVFLAIAFVTSIWTMFYFLIDYNTIVENYLHAKTINTPFSHIRYSLMLSFAIGAGIYLIWKRITVFFAWEVIAVAIITVFLIIFIHVLAVRSGLLALYGSLGYLAVVYLIKTRNWKLTVGAILLLISIPVLAYILIPTFQNKLTYMRMDIENFRSGKSISQFSDARRIVSIKAGFDLGMSQPVYGIGIKNLPKALGAYYLRNYPELEEDEYLIPHNQLAYIFSCTGFIGLFLFGLFLIYPLFKNRNYLFLPFGLINVIMWSSFLSEATIENQLGTTFIITFYLMGLTLLKNYPFMSKNGLST